MKKEVFKDFSEYLFFTKHLTSKQCHALSKAMSPSQRESLKADYKNGGWEDLLVRDKLDSLLEDVNEKYSCNLLDIRYLVLHGKKVYVNKKFWNHVTSVFGGFSAKNIHYILGGIKVTESDSNADEVVLSKDK